MAPAAARPARCAAVMAVTLLCACQSIPLSETPAPSRPADEPPRATTRTGPPPAAGGSVAVNPPTAAAPAAVPAAPAIVPPPPRAPTAAPASGAVRYEREVGELRLAIADADWLAAWPAWLASCRALTAARHPRRNAWNAVCTEAMFLAPSRGDEVRAFFSRFMDRYRVLALDTGAAATATGSEAGAHDTGLMTGYYEPVLEGSRVRTGNYTVPIYRLPPVAVTATRAEIAASGRMRGQELLWVCDPVEAFFLEVQGSGRIHLTDGNWVRVAYAGSNGLAYQSIGRWLVDQGELPLGQVSQQAIRAWSQAHPQRVAEMLAVNPRVVFFREAPVGDPQSGPVGSLGVALTPGVSVAVDPRFVPLGAPLLLDTRAPISDLALTRLAMAQDTGGAIVGPLRVDWFWGLGPGAGDIAGHQHAAGTVRLLVPHGVPPEALF